MADKKTAIKKQPGGPINPTLAKKKQLKKYELYKRGLDVSFKSGGVASGMRRFNRGGKV